MHRDGMKFCNRRDAPACMCPMLRTSLFTVIAGWNDTPASCGIECRDVIPACTAAAMSARADRGFASNECSCEAPIYFARTPEKNTQDAW